MIPAIVTGTFDHPRFTPDVAAVAQMRLKNAIPTTGGGIQSILDAVTGQQQKPNQTGQQSQPNPLGALDSIFRKKK